MSGRRRYVPDWPEHLGTMRRRLGRVMLLLSIGIVLTTVITARLRPLHSTTPIATTTNGTPGAPGSVTTIQHRADGWYLAHPEAWPEVSVVRVIDGDTLDVSAGGALLRVGLLGITAPAANEPCAMDATARLGVLAGDEVRLVADLRQQDGNGRELRYLFTPGGRSIDAALIDDGLAHAWRADGALRTELLGIENAAQSARRGCLWAD